MSEKKIYAMLGLAMKAGQLSSGGYAVEKAIRERRAGLVIVAEDAAKNSKDKIRSMTEYYKVPMEVYGSKETLGSCIGKDERFALALTGDGFCDKIKELLGEMQRLYGGIKREK